VDSSISDPSGGVVGIEVKAASTVTERDTRGLHALKAKIGDRLAAGLVLYRGPACYQMANGFWAVPVGHLFAAPDSDRSELPSRDEGPLALSSGGLAVDAGAVTSESENDKTMGYDGLLVGVDDSKYSWDALAGAERLALAAGLPVQLFHASAGNARVEPEMHEAASRAGLPLIVREAGGSAGDKAEVMAKYAAEHNLLPMITTHGRPTILKAALGSTATELVAVSTRPVVLMGPNHKSFPEPPSRVLCCIDGSEFSEATVREAAKWANAMKVPIWLIQALDPKDGAATTESGYVRNVARELNNQFGEVEWDVVHGSHPGDAIAVYANEQPGTVTVTSTHARTGIDRILHGSVTDEMVRHSEGPVIVYRPGVE